ncbi:MAG: hypothetical protein LBH85_06630 [Treponema sp.]|jgi:hypothetical protein|nr:hypothetical protein [Treponema sp.]
MPVPAARKPDGKKNQPFRTNSSALPGQKLEARAAPSQHAGARVNPLLRERRGGQTQTRQTEASQPEEQKIHVDEVIASPRLIWDFFWYKCGKPLAPLMRRQMGYIAL